VVRGGETGKPRANYDDIYFVSHGGLVRIARRSAGARAAFVTRGRRPNEGIGFYL
jgi:hypothetical protein